MKKYLIALSALTIVTVSTNAQTTNQIHSDKRQSHEKMGHKKHDHHEKAMMMKQLNLSDAQKQQSKSIRSDYHKQLKQLEQDKNVTPRDFSIKKTELQKEQRSKFESMLTTEQKNKLAETKKENSAKRKIMSEKKMEKMKSELNLNDAQLSKLKSQHDIFKAQAKAITENTSLTKEQKKEQLMDLKKRSKEMEKNILTTEQVQKREEMRKRRFNEMKNKRTERS
ncbi:MAG: hypothetical protein ABIO81_01820 [Ginsengibacter sp.]